MESGLRLYYQNIRGIRTKTNVFYQNVLAECYDVILITETWLNYSFLNTEICDKRYEVFRCDRSVKSSEKSIGGGVMICINRSYQPSERPEFAQEKVEMLWVTINRNTSRKIHRAIHIGIVYIPGDSQQPQRLSLVEKSLLAVSSAHPDDFIILAGDFNLPNIIWSEEGSICLNPGSTEIQHSIDSLLHNISLVNLKQFNFYPNNSNNTLDLLFSNTLLLVKPTIEPLLPEDKFHPALDIDGSEIQVKLKHVKSQIKYNFHKADYTQIKEELNNINWECRFHGKTTEQTLESLYEVLYCLIECHVSKSKSYNKMFYPPWFSKVLISIIKEKANCHKKWKKFNNPRDYDEFKLLRTRQKRLQKECYQTHISRMQDHIRTSPKIFWSYIKSKRQNDCAYPKTLYLDQNKYNNEPDICEGFQKFFESVYIPPAKNYKECTENQLHNCNDTIHSITFNKEDVKNLLKSLDASKGPGSDNIPPVFLKYCANELAEPLTILFKMSLKEGVFPSKWKEAHIVPIHKKGSKSDISNYRPISILNTLGKVLEKIVLSNLYPTVARAIPSHQHGFMKNRSTTTNLCLFMNDILRHMDRGGQVDVVYTDFEKAFDRVDHFILLQKLFALGICGDLYRWIKSYITNRTQAVKIGGSRSNFITITSGVPQGSHLGPLLYNTYLIDINHCFKNAKYLMFADDKKVYLNINNIDDCKRLQADLNNLALYYQKNNITVNIGKCSQISFTRKKYPIQYTYKINNQTINKTNSIRDLGVQLDSKLLMSDHTNIIVSKAYSMLGFVFRICRPFTSIPCLKSIYFAYIRNILEYASCVWCPRYNKYIDSIESIQKKFVKYLNFKTYHHSENYESSCRHYRISTLKDRRELLDMMFLHSLFSGRLDSPELLGELSIHTPSKRTRHTNNHLFYVPQLRTSYSSNSVLCRIPHLYNKKYSNIDPFALTARAFKTKILEIQNRS